VGSRKENSPRHEGKGLRREGNGFCRKENGPRHEGKGPRLSLYN
jgi:hypothetical protein